MTEPQTPSPGSADASADHARGTADPSYPAGASPVRGSERGYEGGDVYYGDDEPPPPSHAPPGVRMLVAGALIAALGPLAGFLGGSMTGQAMTVAGLTPMYLWMFGGLVVGGIGGILAIVGGLRWARHNHEYQAERNAEIRAARERRRDAEQPDRTRRESQR